MKQGDLFSVQMYADIPWVLATGGQKGELAIWDTEEDQRIRSHFKEKLTDKARQMKKKADKGYTEADADMAGGDDSSGFEDVDSDEEDDEAETQEVHVEVTDKKKKSAKKANK